MNTSRPINDEHVRLWLVFVFMIGALLFLGACLWRIQVFRGHEFQSSQMKQSIRNVRVPGVRGRIFDRNAVCLVDNKPSFNVALYLEELRRPGAWSNTISGVEKLVAEVSDIIRRPPELSRDDIRAHVRKRLPLPLTAWRGIDEAALARLMEKTAGRAGIDITTDAVRTYPFGKLASQTIGYIGRSNPAETAGEETEDYHYYLPEIEGKSGLEKILDDQLRGVAGGRLLRIDVSGYRRDDIGQIEPTPGRDVQLALDAKIQKLVEDALGDTPGAAALIDPRNGDVLALASSPSFDPNQFVPFITDAAWAELASDPDKPLLNRAISEHYAPGSTFKPITLMAALDSAKLHGDEHFDCSGAFEVGNSKFHCWNRAGHGDLTISKAIEFSCNVYMFNSALLCGAQPIHDMAAALGLGSKTRIGLEGETGGTCPDDAWKRKVLKEGWRTGDTCNYAIGQGFMSATPLQMALVTAAFANGGNLYRPRLILGSRAAGEHDFSKLPPELVRQMTWNLDHLNIVRRGMFDVIMSPTGTGRLAHAPGVQMAGKTGTAQFETKDGMKRHAWMIAFAPFNEPRYAIAMVVDEGVSGGETIAPRIKKIFSGLFPQTTGNGASG